MATLKRNISIGTAICVLVAATAVAALAQGEDPPPGEGVSQVTAIEQDAQDAMAVLEDTRTSADAMPTDIADQLDTEADFGMNPDLSRRSIANISSSVYLIPGSDHVCAALTVGEGASLSCPETADVADGQAGPTTVGLDGDDIAIYGIVPDGVESVTVETGVSGSANVETADNAYYTVIEAQTALRALSYTGPSGPVAFPIYDPSLAFEEEPE